MVPDRLIEYIRLKKIKNRVFEKEVGVSMNSIYNAVSNNRSISSDTLAKIVEVYSDLNPVWLLTGKGDMLCAPQKSPLPQYTRSIKVKNDNMSPILRPGDIILYKKIKTKSIIWRQMYLVKLEGYSTIAYLHPGLKPETILLVSENKMFQDKEIEISAIQEIGYITASVRINTAI